MPVIVFSTSCEHRHIDFLLMPFYHHWPFVIVILLIFLLSEGRGSGPSTTAINFGQGTTTTKNCTFRCSQQESCALRRTSEFRIPEAPKSLFFSFPQSTTKEWLVYPWLAATFHLPCPLLFDQTATIIPSCCIGGSDAFVVGELPQSIKDVSSFTKSFVDLEVRTCMYAWRSELRDG